MRTFALLSLCLGLASALPSGIASAGGPGRYVTQLGRRVLALSDMVAVGEVSSVNPPFRGVTTARITIEKRLSGLDRSRLVTLMYISDYLAPDAIRSTFEEGSLTFRPKRSERLKNALKHLDDSAGEERAAGNTATSNSNQSTARTPGQREGAKGVRLLKGERGIFFLHRRGASYALIGFIPERDPRYARKQKRLEEVIAIESITTLDSRVRASQSLYLKSLKLSDTWERGNAAREIEALTERFSSRFNATQRQFLAERLYLERDPTIASALERAVRAVAPDEAFAYAIEAEQRERETYAKALAREEKFLASNKVTELRAADLLRLATRYGRAATELLCRHLLDAEPIIRESAAGALSRDGGPSCRPPLRAALAKETDTDAARAMIHTLGVKSDPEAVALIAKRLRDPKLEQAAVQALGRIDTADAMTALDAYITDASPSAKSLIESLLAERSRKR